MTDPLRDLAAKATNCTAQSWTSGTHNMVRVGAQEKLDSVAPELAVLCADLADALRAWRRREVFSEGTYDLYPAADAALAAYDALKERIRSGG